MSIFYLLLNITLANFRYSLIILKLNPNGSCYIGIPPSQFLMFGYIYTFTMLSSLGNGTNLYGEGHSLHHYISTPYCIMFLCYSLLVYMLNYSLYLLCVCGCVFFLLFLFLFTCASRLDLWIYLCNFGGGFCCHFLVKFCLIPLKL